MATTKEEVLALIDPDKPLSRLDLFRLKIDLALSDPEFLHREVEGYQGSETGRSWMVVLRGTLTQEEKDALKDIYTSRGWCRVEIKNSSDIGMFIANYWAIIVHEKDLPDTSID